MAEMIKINLLKPGIMVYDDSEPGGIMDIKFETEFVHEPGLVEILWDKKSFDGKFIKEKKESKWS